MPYTTPAFVRSLSYSGEFDQVADAIIQRAIEEAAPHYGSAVARGAKLINVTYAEGLHAAHLLHMGKKEEAGDDADNQPGVVKGASLAGVGSWSFGDSSEPANNGQGKGGGPINDWAKSPYGKRWRVKYDSFPTGITPVPGVLS